MGGRRFPARIGARIAIGTQKKPRSRRGLRQTGSWISNPSSQPRASASTKASDEVKAIFHGRNMMKTGSKVNGE